MNTETKNVFYQILAYISDAYLAHRLLSEILKGDPFKLWMNREIEQLGESQEHKLKYAFHGVGCSVKSKIVTVDFDYSSNGEIGTFNKWSIYEYMNGKKLITSQDAFEKAYDELLSKAIIVKSNVELGREHKLATLKQWESVYGPG